MTPHWFFFLYTALLFLYERCQIYKLKFYLTNLNFSNCKFYWKKRESPSSFFFNSQVHIYYKQNENQHKGKCHHLCELKNNPVNSESSQPWWKLYLSISTWLSLRSRRCIYCHGNIWKVYVVLAGRCLLSCFLWASYTLVWWAVVMTVISS